VFKSIILVLVFFGLANSAAARVLTYHRNYSTDAYSFGIFYRSGGVTAAEAKKQTRAFSVIPGGYHGLMKFHDVWRRENVDLTIVNGNQLADYLHTLGRPILAIRDGEVHIFGSYRSFRVAGVFDYAVAGDAVAINKRTVRARTIIAVKNRNVHAIVMYGTHQMCADRMAKLGLGKYMFLDGGSSLLPTAKNPSYVVIIPTTSTQLNLGEELNVKP